MDGILHEIVFFTNVSLRSFMLRTFTMNYMTCTHIYCLHYLNKFIHTLVMYIYSNICKNKQWTF